MGETVFSHFWTLSAISPVYRHLFSYQPSNLPTLFLFFQDPKVSRNGRKHFLPFPDTCCRFSCFQAFFLLFLEPIVSRNGRKRFLPFPDTFSHFSCFQTLFLLFLDPKVSRNRRKWIFVFSHFQTLFVVSPFSGHFFSYFSPKSVQKREKMK